VCSIGLVFLPKSLKTDFPRFYNETFITKVEKEMADEVEVAEKATSKGKA